MPEWRSLERGARAIAGTPTVGIQATKGNLTLNQAAFIALGSPEAVEVLYDPDERLIGLRAATLSTATYPVHKQGKSATYWIAGKALVRAMNLDVSRARRYDATLLDGVLTLDLKQGGTPVTAGAPRRS
jgi:hypothetical protein